MPRFARFFQLLSSSHSNMPSCSHRCCNNQWTPAIDANGREADAPRSTPAPLLLSTLRSYVESHGGRLDLMAKFPDRPGATEDAPFQGRALRCAGPWPMTCVRPAAQTKSDACLL